MKKYLSLALVVLLLLSTLVGCAASEQSAPSYNKSESADLMADGFASMDSYYDEAAPEAAPEAPMSSEGKPSQSATQEYLSNQKLIYSSNVEIETLTFEETTNAVRSMIEKYDGFVESDYVSDDSWNWYYSDYKKTNGTMEERIVIRIPTENYKSFLEDLTGTGKVISKSENVENITKSYNDTTTTIEVLEKERDMLLDMMDQATSIQDMITVEERLSEIQRNLALLNSSKNEMDVDIAFSTITVNIREVVEYTRVIEEETFGQRVVNAIKDSTESFGDFLSGLVIVLIFMCPYLVIIALIVIVIIVCVKRKKNKKNEAMNHSIKVASTVVETAQTEKQEPVDQIKE